MRGLILAWLVAEGIISYRSITAAKRPPMPGALLGASGLFVALALLAEAQPKLATMFGVGVDIAAVLALPGFAPVTSTQAPLNNEPHGTQ